MKKLLLLGLLLISCSNALESAHAEDGSEITDGIVVQEVVSVTENIVGTWEFITFSNSLDTSGATTIEEAIEPEISLGEITFNADGTFTTEIYDEDVYYGGEPLHGLFVTDNLYLKPETLNLTYAVRYNRILTLRYYGNTSIANEFEVRDFALTIVHMDSNQVVLTYDSYDSNTPYVLVRI